MLSGRPRSAAAALETGRVPWAAVLDEIRLEFGVEVAAVVTAQVRRAVEQLVAVGKWKPGGPKIPAVLDAGYDAPQGSTALRTKGGLQGRPAGVWPRDHMMPLTNRSANPDRRNAAAFGRRPSAR